MFLKGTRCTLWKLAFDSRAQWRKKKTCVRQPQEVVFRRSQRDWKPLFILAKDKSSSSSLINGDKQQFNWSNSYHYFIFDPVGRPVRAQIFFHTADSLGGSQKKVKVFFFLRNVFALITHMKKSVAHNVSEQNSEYFIKIFIENKDSCWWWLHSQKYVGHVNHYF